VNNRLKQFAVVLGQSAVDAYLITYDIDVSYLAEFPASESWLVCLPRKSYYITDSRYVLEARQGLKGISLRQYTRSPYETTAALLLKHGVKRLGVDGQRLTLAQFERLREVCSKTIKIRSIQGAVSRLRQIKEQAETLKIREALAVHHKALGYLRTVIQPGRAERDILLKLEHFVKSRRVGFSFPPIIASGPNACFPHAKVTDRKIQNHEAVLVDFGIDVDGYKSDLTRMFFLGRIPANIREVYEAVQCAQLQAIRKIRPGISAAAVDREARGFLKEKGLARYFGHSLGHGVGLEIHEDPRISPKSHAVLEEGMIFTVEPAVYIPNQFGVRVEDMVRVTPDGCEVISQTFQPQQESP
jgi:Xaa-Pro aminopeptidase